MKKFFTIFFTLMPFYAIAADAAHDLDWAGLGYRVLLFVIFIVLLYILLKKPVRNMLVKRTEDIEKALAAAEKAKAEALAQVKDYENKMIALEKELVEMKENALKAAERERELILSEAEKTVGKMKQFAVNMIASETEKAKADLRREIAELATKEAEKRIQEDMKDSKSKEVLSEYIKRIGA